MCLCKDWWLGGLPLKPVKFCGSYSPPLFIIIIITSSDGDSVHPDRPASLPVDVVVAVKPLCARDARRPHESAARSCKQHPNISRSQCCRGFLFLRINDVLKKLSGWALLPLPARRRNICLRATSHPAARTPVLWRIWAPGCKGSSEQSLSLALHSTDSRTAACAHAHALPQKHTAPAAWTYGVIMNSRARPVNVLNVTLARESIYAVLPHAVRAPLIGFGARGSSPW